MGRACDTNGMRQILINLWPNNVRGIDYVRDTGVDERIILKWMFKEFKLRKLTRFMWSIRMFSGQLPAAW
jgi:hypothetical protein